MTFTEWYKEHYGVTFREAEKKANNPVSFDYHMQSAEIGYVEYCKREGLAIIMNVY